MEKVPLSFDSQAPSFDARAGLSDANARKIAETIFTSSNLRNGDTILEIGAGTGEIGHWLCRPEISYIGLDNASAMLDEFSARLGDAPSARLVFFDANNPWPVEDRTVRLIFGSRVFHLLDIDHLVDEALRVAHPEGATLLMGRVKRGKDSVKDLMREKMRELLVEHGLAPRPTEKKRKMLLERALARGGEVLEPFEAGRWEARPRPIDSIEGWQGKDSMGGINPPLRKKEKVLLQLRDWAKERFGDLEKEIATEEKYILEGIRFRAQGEN